MCGDDAATGLEEMTSAWANRQQRDLLMDIRIRGTITWPIANTSAKFRSINDNTASGQQSSVPRLGPGTQYMRGAALPSDSDMPGRRAVSQIRL